MSVLTYDDLRRATQCRTKPAVERWLKSQGIRYFYSKHGVWTTTDLVNAAGGIRAGASKDEYKPEDVL